MSHTFSTKNGSGESLNDSTRWGCKANACQMRTTVLWDTPVALPMARVLHWVAALGGPAKVLFTNSMIFSSATVRGVPERGKSNNPASRSLTNRPRHLPTVCPQIPNSLATAPLVRPSAHRKTIRALNTTWCGAMRLLDCCSNTSRSDGDNSNAAVGLPLRMAALPQGCWDSLTRKKTPVHTVNEKVLPCPGVDSTCTTPP